MDKNQKPNNRKSLRLGDAGIIIVVVILILAIISLISGVHPRTQRASSHHHSHKPASTEVVSGENPKMRNVHLKNPVYVANIMTQNCDDPSKYLNKYDNEFLNHVENLSSYRQSEESNSNVTRMNGGAINTFIFIKKTNLYNSSATRILKRHSLAENISAPAEDSTYGYGYLENKRVNKFLASIKNIRDYKVSVKPYLTMSGDGGQGIVISNTIFLTRKSD